MAGVSPCRSHWNCQRAWPWGDWQILSSKNLHAIIHLPWNACQLPCQVTCLNKFLGRERLNASDYWLHQIIEHLFWMCHCLVAVFGTNPTASSFIPNLLSHYRSPNNMGTQCSYLCLILDDGVCRMTGILGVHREIYILLHKWTPQAIHPSRHHA